MSREKKTKTTPPADEGAPPLSMDAWELFAAMYRAFDAAKVEMNLGEGLLQALAGHGPLEPIPAKVDLSPFGEPEIRAVTRALEAFESRCLADVDNLAVRAFAERVTAQLVAMILWTLLFMRRLGGLARSGGEERATESRSRERSETGDTQTE